MPSPPERWLCFQRRRGCFHNVQKRRVALIQLSVVSVLVEGEQGKRGSLRTRIIRLSLVDADSTSSGGQSIGVSASASVLPMNIQD